MGILGPNITHHPTVKKKCNVMETLKYTKEENLHVNITFNKKVYNKLHKCFLEEKKEFWR